jgi:hypothetical protein
MTEPYRAPRGLHDVAAAPRPAGLPEPVLTVGAVMDGFARKLTALNDRHVRMNLPVLPLQDPRDIVGHIDRLAGHLKFSAHDLDPETVDALGAQCIALRLALARVEDGDPHSGGEDAA